MKKLKLSLLLFLAAAMAAGTGLRAQEVTRTLMPGWTWISCPTTDTLDFATAMGSFVPMSYDIITTQGGAAVYMNGRWMGTVSQFYPGYGYHYKSNRTEPVTVTFQAQPSSQVAVTTLEPTDITHTSAVVGGNVAINAGNHIFARGVCWGTEEMPTVDGIHTSDETVAGSQNITIDSLTPSTTYYVRAYMVTDYGLVYGSQQSFTTLSGEHAYVDLGLPSGLLWATHNVGAEAPEDYGDYFAWGETESKNNYNWSSYQYCNGSSSTLTKYCDISDYGYNGFTDNLTILRPEDDAATASWGSVWRLPTKEEWEELYQNTTHTWTTQNGVNGWMFSAPNGNNLFLPAADSRWYSSLPEPGAEGRYYSSSIDINNPDAAWIFYYSSWIGGISNNYYRSAGYSVRPVRFASQNTSFIIDALVSPTWTGRVSGGGFYQQGGECTVHAVANTGYTFANWTENGNVVSTNATYTFAVDTDRTLVANFTVQSYTISVSANPNDGGSLSGEGNYNYGQSCTLQATPNPGYTFTNWTENGGVVSTDATYTFTVRADRNLVANFAQVYVDLGLPSGLLWATCNLGADNPEDYGDYFAWGETQPKDNFSWTNYQYCMGSFNTLTKYCNNPDIGYNGFTDDLTTLLPEDDAATANWGDEWRMPTEGEWQELYQNTTVTWTTRNGVRGRLFTAENGNSIFMPASGYCNESVPEAAGIIGDYWTSSLDPDYPSGALSFFFNSSNYYISFCNRLYGRNVRAVRSSQSHAYVDLGLPSGLLWATCNVGADNPEDYGDYFAWGETTTKSTYNWSTYQYCNGHYNTLTKYCNNSSYGYNGFTDNLTTLLPEDDAATANWGNGWRMPTKEEFQELYNNTTVTWTTQNGVNGRLFTASNGNSLFLPAAGYRWGDELGDVGDLGYYWSSSLYTDNPYDAWFFGFFSGSCGMGASGRYYGLSVRAVRSGLQN